jgi:hypothetical protein
LPVTVSSRSVVDRAGDKIHDDWTRIAGSKRRTTMAKLNRERKLLERRAEKQAKKDARKRARAEGGPEVGQRAASTT